MKQKKIIIASILASLVAILWINKFNRSIFTNPDAYDYAQIAHNLNEGNGMSTSQIFPRHISYFSKKNLLIKEKGSWPNFYRYPVPVLSNSLFQLFEKDIVDASIKQTGFWLLLCVLMLFILASYICNYKLALLTCITFLSDPNIWWYSYSGLTELNGLFFVLLTLYVVYRYSSINKGWIFIGVIAGLAYLTRTQLLFLGITSFIYLLVIKKKHKIRCGLYLLSGFLLIILPWMVRNIAIIGKPLFSFSTTRNLVLGTKGINNDLEMKLNAPSEISSVIDEYGMQIIYKFFNNIWPEIFSPFELAGGTIYGGLFIVVILTNIYIYVLRSNIPFKKIKIFIITSIIVNFFIIGFAFNIERYFYQIRPLIIILCVIDILILFKIIFNIRYYNYLLNYIIVLSSLYFIGVYIIMLNFGSSKIGVRNIKNIDNIINNDAIIASNVSYYFPVHTDNISIRIPGNPNELKQINNNYINIDYLYLSNNIFDNCTKNKDMVFTNYYQYCDHLNIYINDLIEVKKFKYGAVLYKWK